MSAAHAGESVKLEQQSDEWAQVAVQGPRAPELVEKLCSRSVLDVPYYHFREGTVAGVRGCLIARTGYTGEDGFEVFCPPDGARRIWDAVLQEGAVPCGLGARDTLRLEAGYRLYGNDMDEQHTPLEAGLDWIVKLQKSGGFIGAEALREQKARGLERKLVGFKMSAKRHIARHGYPVRPPGVEKHVGEVTSGTMSPTLKQPIGLAYVPIEMSPEGTCFEVEIRDHAFPAEVVKTPFVSKKS